MGDELPRLLTPRRAPDPQISLRSIRSRRNCLRLHADAAQRAAHGFPHGNCRGPALRRRCAAHARTIRANRAATVSHCGRAAASLKMDTTRTRLERCFALTFPRLEPSQYATASAETMADWDSVAQVTLLTV